YQHFYRKICKASNKAGGAAHYTACTYFARLTFSKGMSNIWGSSARSNTQYKIPGRDIICFQVFKAFRSTIFSAFNCCSKRLIPAGYNADNYTRGDAESGDTLAGI